jgi:hypothetical protein
LYREGDAVRGQEYQSNGHVYLRHLRDEAHTSEIAGVEAAVRRLMKFQV